MNLKLKAYNCIATPDRVQMIRSNMYRLVNIVGSDGKIVYVAGGYPKNIWNEYLEQRIDELNISIDGTIAIINDIALEAVNRLMMKGYHNFVVVGTDESLLQKIDRSVNIVYYYDKENVTIETCLLGDLKSMGKEFDLIISNPPYAIGNEITKTIIDNINFREFINLMPISDYYKNKLFRNISKLNDHFVWNDCVEESDAMVGVYVCNLKKEANVFNSKEELQLQTYDQKWIKYYKEQLVREDINLEYHPWISDDEALQYFNSRRCFMLTNRTAVDGVHKTTECFDYKWNVSHELLQENGKIKLMRDYKVNKVGGLFSLLPSEQICNNIIAYWYNSKIMSGIIKGLNKQGFINPQAFLPKVDWNHPWTDEEILRDYGYTEEEIQNILND